MALLGHAGSTPWDTLAVLVRRFMTVLIGYEAGHYFEREMTRASHAGWYGLTE